MSSLYCKLSHKGEYFVIWCVYRMKIRCKQWWMRPDSSVIWEVNSLHWADHSQLRLLLLDCLPYILSTVTSYNSLFFFFFFSSWSYKYKKVMRYLDPIFALLGPEPQPQMKRKILLQVSIMYPAVNFLRLLNSHISNSLCIKDFRSSIPSSTHLLVTLGDRTLVSRDVSAEKHPSHLTGLLTVKCEAFYFCHLKRCYCQSPSSNKWHMRSSQISLFDLSPSFMH